MKNAITQNKFCSNKKKRIVVYDRYTTDPENPC
jgi:hypothetical protein